MRILEDRGCAPGTHPGGRRVLPSAVSDQTREASADSVSGHVDVTVEPIGDRVTVGAGSHDVVSSPERVDAAGERDGPSVYQVVLSGDSWMISSHSFTEVRGS